MTQPAHRDLLRFEQKNGMLRNVLSVEVPNLAAEYAGRVLKDVLHHAKVSPAQISGWVIHPGGRDVLIGIQKAFQLRDSDLRWSAAVLDRYGNLSSSSVFFVLKEALTDSAPPGIWWMCSFGAGFTCHGALLEVG